MADVIGQNWPESDEIRIDLSATPSGIMTITEAGTYRLSGTMAKGGIIVDVPGNGLVRLILDNAHITNPVGSALGIIDADGGTAIVVAAGTVNSLTDGATYADTSDDAPDSTLYADDDLVIFGSGTLNITGNANRGINAKDGFVFDQAILNINSIDDGIRGKDFLVILGGSLNIVSGDDGLNSNNVTDNVPLGQIIIAGGNVTIDAVDDAITAEALVYSGRYGQHYAIL